LEKAIDKHTIEPFGVVTWSSSHLASERLDYIFGRNIHDIKISKYDKQLNLIGKTLVDLGCGTGNHL
jgi:2-polyprenyl-3-methyl-5-hydroxy-6-metoxy-1,4-benzoquinol methylase